jgi:quercetin dioxygenase-like cupin family protein
MSDRTDADRLDELVDAIMADEPTPALSPRLTELLAVAADLRDLPRADWKARLGAELAAGASAPAPMTPHDLTAIARDLPTLVIGADTTAAQADAATRMLTWLGDLQVGMMRFSGLTPWERHPDGDELLQVLDGAVDVTVLTDDGPVDVPIETGGIFICPRGLWHRQRARPTVTILFGTPVRTSQVSFADDPRT